MDISHELPEALTENRPSRRRLSSGLATPALIEHSDEPSPNNSTSDIGLSAELSYHEKLRRFKLYMNLCNVDSVEADRYAATDDDDEYYNDGIVSKTLSVKYVQRPSRMNLSGTVPQQCSESVFNAYERYDLRKKQVIKESGAQPGKKYDDCLDIQAIDDISTHTICFNEFKNNLVGSWKNFTFFASDSLIFVDDGVDRYYIETRPRFTTRDHIAAAVIRHAPHSINFIKVSKFAEKDVLIVCVDDGRALIYELGDKSPEMLVQIKLKSSVWGADSSGDFLAFSDNSHTLTLFLIRNNCVYCTTTIPLMSNIPDLEIVHVHGETVLVSCISISGELVIFEFNIQDTGKQTEDEVLDPLRFDIGSDVSQEKYRITSHVRNRSMLSGDGWTVNKIHESYFKEVNDPSYLGMTDLNPRNILEKSKVLNLSENHLVTSNLGGAARFENIHIRTKYDALADRSDNLNSFTSNFHRIRKKYFRTSEDEPNHSACLNDLFLLITTHSRTALYSADGLICNCHTGDMFDVELPSDSAVYFNRMSIARVIPGLSAVIVVSQAGFFTIFRLVKHRGVYSFREEYTESISTEDYMIENAENGDEVYSSVAGCLVTKLSDSEDVYSIKLLSVGYSLKEYIVKQTNDIDNLLVDSLV